MKKRRILILFAFAGVAVAGIAVFYLLAQRGIGIGCLFHEITGLQCPGCGNSRAALALLRLDVVGALRYNLLFPLEFSYLLWVLCHGSMAYLKSGRFRYLPKWVWMDASVLALVLIWGIVRNFIGI